MRRRILLVVFSLSACEPAPLVPPTVDEDASLPAASWNGSRFHLVEEGTGEGPPVIFLSGGPGNDVAYLRGLDTACDGARLSDHLPVIWWDQRGTGLSRRHDAAELTLDHVRGDLDGLVERVDPSGQGVVLIGHSWGGTFAADFANRHPARVVGLVLFEPGELTEALLRDNPTPSFLTLGSEAVNDFAWGQSLLSLDDHEALDFHALALVESAQSYRVSREDPVGVRLGAAVIRNNLLGGFYPEGFDFTTHLDAVGIEVLFVAGDTPTSDLGAALQRRQLDVFPDARLEVFDGDGHTDVVVASACRAAGVVQDYLAGRGLIP